MPRRSQAERTEASRAQLVEAATVLFGERGYAGTTLREVGERAGVSSGLATYHFGTKDALFRAVLETIRKGVDDAAETVGGDQLRGLAWIDNWATVYLRGYTPHPSRLQPWPVGRAGRTVFVAIAEAISASPVLLDAVASNDQAFRSLIRNALEEAIEDGDIHEDADTALAAIAIVGLLRGIALQRLTAPDEIDIEALLDTVHAMVGVAPVHRPESGAPRSG